jgi:TolB-like protein/DNA-binding winged helix-turn-helix (wHTH) protein
MPLSAQTVRFGPFQLDLRAAELRHDGATTKIPEQPFQVLVALVEHPGEVVTREELRQRLWTSNTFVDFEHGLNTAVKRLREVLGDSAEKPRYIETLPRHGYRLMVAVEKPAPTIQERPGRRRRIMLAILTVAIVASATGVFGRHWLVERLWPANIQSLAVLPLENLSGDPEEQYFADGMTQALITELGKSRALRVVSWQSMKQFKGTSISVPQIARELHVDAIVEGAALRAGDEVRIAIQLIQANPERHLWSESYERNFRDVIALQRSVSEAIVGEITGKVLVASSTTLAKSRPVNPEAYEAYLRGRYYFDQWPDGLERAVQYFQAAIDKDPNYAPALAELALCYASLGYFDSPKEVFPKARTAAERALELDELQPEAHAALAFAKFELRLGLAWSRARIPPRHRTAAEQQ